ncbi:hypothetical protein IWQ62_000992 [Dispira parvispora]|uniref:Uncharacterized protein n=1 Tax=Dispira parvispora TaxID=1520584 RepID=A0A9W8AYW9_9FUNG|nr:hypothetical protein IWQ62_000992 [Dispira parvispora]
MCNSVFQLDEEIQSTSSRSSQGISIPVTSFCATETALDAPYQENGIVESLVVPRESSTLHHVESTVPRGEAPEQAYLNAIVQEAQARSTKVGLDDFQTMRLIGQGAYGRVFLVQHKQKGQYFAMKVVPKSRVVANSRQITFTKAERAILEDVQHPFVVRLFYAFQTAECLYLILEYASGGELFHHMNVERMFTERVARFFAAEIVLALEHLHTLGIIYRDLKPENCLLDSDGHIVLTDFGLSKLGLPENGKTNTFCGTIEYMAPEVLDESPYDQSVDWWSLGILLYDMITGAPPFKGTNKKKVMDAIRHKGIKFPDFVSPDARDLITQLLSKDPAKRLGTFTGVPTGLGPQKGKRRSRPQPLKVSGSRIRAHRFFRCIDWKQMEARRANPPIIPRLEGEGDTSNFDEEFTAQPMNSSTLVYGTTPVSPSTDQLFLGFSYTALHHLA